MASWFDRLLHQPSPEQLVTLQLRTLIQLQQETNLLLREAIYALGKSPTTPVTLTVIDQAYGNTPNSSTREKHRIRGKEDLSSTDDVHRPKPMTESVETAPGLDPDSHEPPPPAA